MWGILTSGKTDFKIKTVTRDKKGHFIMMKGSTQQKDRILVNIYTTNVESPIYKKQILTK